jgi:TIR domain
MVLPGEQRGAVGFWSYVHADDDAEGGRIFRLAERLRNEYSVLTGDDLQIFVDREDLAWGDEWRRRIADALSGTTFFIPIFTPRYLRSEECRRELLTFAGHAQSFGVTELLLPILYAEVQELAEDSDDEAAALIARTQYVNWSELRLVDETSEAYRQAVNGLAKRLMDVAQTLEARPVVLPEAPEEDEPGLVDKLAEAEAALPRWQAAIEELGPVAEEIGAAMQRAAARAEQSDASGKGFAGRIIALQGLASELEPLTTRLLQAGTDYASEVVKVDAGVLTLIRMAEAEAIDDDAARAAYCDLFETIKSTAKATREMVGEVDVALEGLRSLEGLSRNLRPPLKKMEDGLRRVRDAQSVIDEWVSQIEASKIDCSDIGATG